MCGGGGETGEGDEGDETCVMMKKGPRVRRPALVFLMLCKTRARLRRAGRFNLLNILDIRHFLAIWYTIIHVKHVVEHGRPSTWTP